MPRKNNLNERERPEHCPACGAEVLNHQETIKTWICEKCSYVLDSDEQPSVSDTSILAEEDTNDETDQIDWESEIAVSGNDEVNLINALSRTEDVADAVGFSDERTLRAGEMIAEAWQTNFMHGRSKERTIGAVVYAVSREVNTALPPAMIAKEMKVSKANIKQTYQTLTRELGLDIGPPVPRDFVAILREELELSPSVESAATTLLQQQAVSGGNPIGIAAAGLYAASDDSETNLTLKQLAKVTDLTKETIWRQKEQLVD